MKLGRVEADTLGRVYAAALEVLSELEKLRPAGGFKEWIDEEGDDRDEERQFVAGYVWGNNQAIIDGVLAGKPRIDRARKCYRIWKSSTGKGLGW